MSNAIFPSVSLPGFAWPKKTTGFSTIRQLSAGGQQVRIPNFAYGLTTWELTFNVLDFTTGAYQTLKGFFGSRLGPWDYFLFFDQSDSYTVNNSNGLTGVNLVGTGDGTTTEFQLMRALDGDLQPIYAINGITATYNPPIATPFVNVWLNSTPDPSSNWSVNSAGLLTFTSAPGSGVSIFADFSYFFRAVFTEDTMSFDNFVQNLFSAEGVKIEQVYA